MTAGLSSRWAPRAVMASALASFPMCYGPEFISRELDLRAWMSGVTLDFSRPGKPTDDAFIETFNGPFRAEYLNASWFLSLEDARSKCEAWRTEYNEVRPSRDSLGTGGPVSGASPIRPALTFKLDQSPGAAQAANRLRQSAMTRGFTSIATAVSSSITCRTEQSLARAIGSISVSEVRSKAPVQCRPSGTVRPRDTNLPQVSYPPHWVGELSTSAIEQHQSHWCAVPPGGETRRLRGR